MDGYLFSWIRLLPNICHDTEQNSWEERWGRWQKAVGSGRINYAPHLPFWASISLHSILMRVSSVLFYLYELILAFCPKTVHDIFESLGLIDKLPFNHYWFKIQNFFHWLQRQSSHVLMSIFLCHVVISVVLTLGQSSTFHLYHA